MNNSYSTINMNVSEGAERIKLPRIIINADDYGYCQERSDGIIELIRQGRISSTSVIVNAPAIQKTSIKLKNLLLQQDQKQKLHSKQTQIPKYYNNNKFSIGLHINLTQFHPCSIHQLHTQYSIINTITKIFKGKQYIYNNLSIIQQDKYLLHFIQSQIHQQIQKFIQLFGCKPSHIDGHNHVHIIPCFADVICRIALLYGIYKARLPLPYQYQQNNNIVGNQQCNTVNKYNQKFIKLAKQSKNIYDRYGFVYPDYFIGLTTMGKSIINISQQLQQITNQIQPHCIQDTTIQIMVHAGYKQQQLFNQFTNCQFSQNQQRQVQLQYLKSQQLNYFTNNLTNFHNICKKNCEKSVMIYSKLLKCSGNLTTCLRLRQIFVKLGYRAYLFDVPEQSTQLLQPEEQRVDKFIRQFGIKLIVGVNLTRTAGVIYHVLHGNNKNKGIPYTYKIPYVLIIAGTDANLTLQQSHQSILKQINQSIEKCQVLVSISQKMKEKVQSYIKQHNITKQILLISQCTINQANKYQQITTCSLAKIFPNFTADVPYIIFPTSFRRVKCVQHILIQLNSLINMYNINVYVMGPIIDQQYYQQIYPLFNKVIYLKGCPHNIYINMLKNSLILINCSQSQGMSCSILQAFAQKVPVIVRANQDGINGFVYRDGKQFIEKFIQLNKDYENIKDKLCGKAYEILQKQYGYQKQVGLYRNLLQKYINPLFYKLQLPINFNQEVNKPQAYMVCLRGVHGISPVNLKIFDKFFLPCPYQSKQNSITPCQKYLSKILKQKRTHINNTKQHIQYNLKILDVGCGSGIFCIYFVYKLIHFISQNNTKQIIRLNLLFIDIDSQALNNLIVNLRMLQQLCTYSSYNKNIVIQNMQVIYSDMFNSLSNQNHKKFDIILANMSQTPFNNPQSRIDKNGGADGLKFTRILIQNCNRFLYNSNSILLMLYSHMLQYQQFNNIIKSNKGYLSWKSQTQIHRIRKQQYQKMEIGLTKLIQDRVYNGKTGVKLQGDIFQIPADLRIIQFI